MVNGIGQQKFAYDHFHRKLAGGDGVAVPYADDGKNGLKDGVVVAVREDNNITVAFFGGEQTDFAGGNVVKFPK